MAKKWGFLHARFDWRTYREVWRVFGRHLLPYWRTLLIAVFGMVAAIALDLARPWPLKLIFDYVLLERPLPRNASWLQVFGTDPAALLLPAAALIVVIAALHALFSFVNKYLMSVVGEKVVIDVRERLFVHLQALSLGFHEKSRSGDLVYRMTSDINKLKKLFVDSIQDFGNHLLRLAGLLATMLWMDWQLCLVGLAILPILYVTTHAFSGSVKRSQTEKRARESDVASIVQENMLSISLIQAYTAEAAERERFQQQNIKSLAAQIRTEQLSKGYSRTLKIVIAIGTAAVVYVGARRVLLGELSPGDLIVFAEYLRQLYGPIDKVADTFVNLAEHLVSGERLVEIADQPVVICDAPGAVPALPFRGEVEFRNVSFRYREDAPVLQNVSMHIRPGQKVALVGSSGAGKTTVANLLMRFYDPAEGQILIDGKDIRTYTVASLRDQITVLLQDTFLFRKTVRENIAYGREDASEEEIVAAAKAAQAHEFILALPDGYETLIEEGGTNFSGGQKQRLNIARAILRNRPILILDEPTTALDALAEAKINKALDRLTKGLTTFVIAHRFSTLASADHIVLLEEGKFSRQGTHAELMASSDTYRKLWRLQYGGGSLDDRQVG